MAGAPSVRWACSEAGRKEPCSICLCFCRGGARPLQSPASTLACRARMQVRRRGPEGVGLDRHVPFLGAGEGAPALCGLLPPTSIKAGSVREREGHRIGEQAVGRGQDPAQGRALPLVGHVLPWRKGAHLILENKNVIFLI